MAEVYLSLDADMRKHLKVRKFCRLMQTKSAIAHLVDLWSAAITQAPDGDLSKIDPEDVEGMAGYDNGDMRCYRALVDSGFIDEVDENGNPCRRIHNWMKPGRTGYAMKKKAEAVESWRQSMNRGKSRTRQETPPTGSPTGAPVVGDERTTDDSPDDPSMTHESPGGSAGGENPLHGSRFTVHKPGSLSSSPPTSQQSGPDRAGARVSIAAALTEPYMNGHKPFPVDAFTVDFMAVYNAYSAAVRGDARDRAALSWREISIAYPGGEKAMRSGFEKWFVAAAKRHPYSGDLATRPYLASVIAEKRWLDDHSAPSDARPKDVRIGHARAEVKDRPAGEVKGF